MSSHGHAQHHGQGYSYEVSKLIKWIQKHTDVSWRPLIVSSKQIRMPWAAIASKSSGVGCISITRKQINHSARGRSLDQKTDPNLSLSNPRFLASKHAQAEHIYLLFLLLQPADWWHQVLIHPLLNVSIWSTACFLPTLFVICRKTRTSQFFTMSLEWIKSIYWHKMTGKWSWKIQRNGHSPMLTVWATCAKLLCLHGLPSFNRYLHNRIAKGAIGFSLSSNANQLHCCYWTAFNVHCCKDVCQCRLPSHAFIESTTITNSK